MEERIIHVLKTNFKEIEIKHSHSKLSHLNISKIILLLYIFFAK